MASSTLVSQSHGNVETKGSTSRTEHVATTVTQPTTGKTSITQEAFAVSMPLVRDRLNNINISTAAQDIIMASWRTGTSKQYQTYLSRWKRFCNERLINHLHVSVENGIEFLTLLFQEGLGYSEINTARSALSTVLHTTGHTFGTHPLVVRFLKGVFKLKPSLPRYTHIWDVGTVLDYIKTLGPVKDLNLKTLTKKLTILLCLLTGQRCQTLTKLDTKLMQATQGKYVFTIGETIKTTKPGKHLDPIELERYDKDDDLCVVRQYLTITSPLRGDSTKLLISYIKPHQPVCSSTIGKWVKDILMKAGIDVTTFSGNSARPATTSYGKATRMTLQEILKAGGWSNAQTFATHYNKPITRNFGTNILQHHQSVKES